MTLSCANASFVTPLVYAAMGSSRHIAIGPAAMVSLLLGAMLSHDIRDHKSHEYLRLAFTATFFIRVTQLALDVLSTVEFGDNYHWNIMLDLPSYNQVHSF
ncbi:high affinity sulfate transporter 2-like [Arachis ipaensis]|uniref:high affinity sulfate transporter 2-like n=1 Tax=Arachis ipaensis TaxID=130454 RepID=UPI000A2B8FF8|nr:high affinity sulfate transporter 2-like [Arachis ipaensis]